MGMGNRTCENDTFTVTKNTDQVDLGDVAPELLSDHL